MDNLKLTKKQMETLKGGTFTDLTQINSANLSAATELEKRDKNTNNTKDCVCTYFNASATNTNKVSGCVCVCI